MKIRHAVVLGIVALFGSVVFAQDFPKVEVPVYYSYMHFNPENSNTVSGFSLNGGGGALIFNVNHTLGIQAEFNGYGSSTKTFTFAGGSDLCPSGCTVSASGNLFTYNVGPVLKYRGEHFQPFVELMFGGAHLNVYGDLKKACQLTCQTSAAPSNNAWDFIIGGGFDIPVGKSISIRPAQFDFVLTRFDSAFTTSNQNQSNFRYQAGIIFRF